MEVKSISNNYTFTGYVGPNLKNYVNIIVKKNVNEIVRNATKHEKSVNTEEIKQAKVMGDDILSMFTKYMAKTEKNTVIDLNNIESSYYIRLKIKNPLAPKVQMNIYSSNIHKKPTLLDNKSIVVPDIQDLKNTDNADNRDLEKLKKYITSLVQINPKAIDKTFLDSANASLEFEGKNATGFWAKIKLNKLAKKIENFAKNIGEESTATTRLKEYFKIAKEIKKETKEQKKLEKANTKIAEKILNS